VHQEAPLLILQLFKSSTCYPTLQTVIHPLQHWREYQPDGAGARANVLWKAPFSVGNRGSCRSVLGRRGRQRRG